MAEWRQWFKVVCSDLSDLEYIHTAKHLFPKQVALAAIFLPIQILNIHYTVFLKAKWMSQPSSASLRTF